MPHEPRALAQLYGDDGEMCAYLTETMTGKSAVKGGSGPGKIYHNGHWGLHHEQVGEQLSGYRCNFLQHLARDIKFGSCTVVCRNGRKLLWPV